MKNKLNTGNPWFTTREEMREAEESRCTVYQWQESHDKAAWSAMIGRQWR